MTSTLRPDHSPTQADPRSGRSRLRARSPRYLDPRSVPLVGQFLVHMFASNLEVRRRQDPLACMPAVDWEAIWSAADGASTTEQAIGRVVVAGYSAALGAEVKAPRAVSPLGATTTPFISLPTDGGSDPLTSLISVTAPSADSGQRTSSIAIPRE